MLFNAVNSSVRLAVYGPEATTPGRGVGLWTSGYRGCIIAADATPVFLKRNTGDRSWSEVLNGCHCVAVIGFEPTREGSNGDAESLCQWAKKHKIPLLAIDNGMLALNSSFGGLNYYDLSRELPEALQHRHPPEPGLRHAINVQLDTKLCDIYGEGEIVVNSEHRAGIQRLANGFRIGGTALDGVIEAIEFATDAWWALGVQWQPASGSASGLDIQVFRSVIDAAKAKTPALATTKAPLAMAG
jgi:gamma-glutamyl-gamma-aminobutyrate hydrolase PuuD